MTASARTALTGVRVFDGDVISADGDTAGASSVDTGGAVLIPGLIDAHVHVDSRGTLEALAAWGVTTALDMACWPASLVDSLRNVPGLTDIRSAGLPAIGPHGPHAQFPNMPSAAIVLTVEHAKAFVAARVAEGSDYIKIVLEDPGNGGLSQGVADTVVAQGARRRHEGRRSCRGAGGLRHGSCTLART